MSERIEEKFIIPGTSGPGAGGNEALLVIARHLPPSYPTPQTLFCDIDSLYFDSPQLDLFERHFSSPEQRFKLRIRRYAPNGVLDSERAWLELKEKIGKTTRKSRLAFHPSDGDALDILNYPWTLLNPELTKHELEARLQRIRAAFLQVSPFLPQCRVRYQRRAFEAPGLRITLDNQISTELCHSNASESFARFRETDVVDRVLEMRRSYDLAPCTLLEVKRSKFRPDWLNDTIQLCRARPVRFSKYCYALGEAFRRSWDSP